MDFDNSILLEEIKLKSKNEALNTLFEIKLREVFSQTYLNKIDRVLDTVLTPIDYKENSNVVAYTKNGRLYVNTPQFYSLKPSKAIIYVLHEFFHLLQDLSSFKDLKNINDELYKVAASSLKSSQFAEFLTGKKQNIHSVFKDEFLTYLMNGSEKLEMLDDKARKEYIQVLEDSNIFNLNSNFWKARIKF